MLTLRQAPLRCPEPRRFNCPSPTMIPRMWVTAAFAASAAYALVMALAGGCMSMLALRQEPLRFPAPRRFDWPSPARVPRPWVTG